MNKNTMILPQNMLWMMRPATASQPMTHLITRPQLTLSVTLLTSVFFLNHKRYCNLHISQLVQVIIENLQQQVYLNISDTVMNSNKTRHFFQVYTTQYATYYKHNRLLLILPVHASFNSNKYKSKKPIPSNNTYITFDSKLVDVQVNSAGKICFLHVSVDNINFLSKASLRACLTNPSDMCYVSLVLLSLSNKTLFLPASSSLSCSLQV